MPRSHAPQLDWLKAVGITLIVYGHVAASTTVAWTPPVYPKQLGVAFFVCAMGYTLRTERRGRWRAVYDRAFEVFFFGLLGALLMSMIGAVTWSDLVESNYLPLAFGANVFVDAFPANPTTWYIGTYFHLLLFWAIVLRNVRVTGAVIALGCVLEISIRSVIIASDKPFIAYMLVSNWITCLLIGLALGQPTAESRRSQRLWIPALLVLMVACRIGFSAFTWRLTFPFMTPDRMGTVAGALLTSVAISAVYWIYTLVGYELALRLPRMNAVRFLARNTLIIFIAHMPLYYALEYFLRPRLTSYATRVALEFLVCLFALACLSEWIKSSASVTHVRERLAGRLGHYVEKYRLRSA